MHKSEELGLCCKKVQMDDKKVFVTLSLAMLLLLCLKRKFLGEFSQPRRNAPIIGRVCGRHYSG